MGFAACRTCSRIAAAKRRYSDAGSLLTTAATSGASLGPGFSIGLGEKTIWEVLFGSPEVSDRATTSAIPPASSDATSIEPKERCTRAWSDIFVSVLSAADNFPHRRRPQTAHGCFLKIWIHAPRIMRNDNARNDYPDPRPSVPVSAHFKKIQNHKIRH